MIEVTSGSVAVSPSSLTPVAPSLPPPGLDSTARTERATRPVQASDETKNQSGRVVEDRVDVRQVEAEEDRNSRRRADENRRQDLAIDSAQEEEAAEEAAARDKHTVDFTA